jgi:hypothetical protein
VRRIIFLIYKNHFCNAYECIYRNEIKNQSKNNMRVAKYIRRGHGISHRARIAKDNDAHPITHWIKEFAI